MTAAPYSLASVKTRSSREPSCSPSRPTSTYCYLTTLLWRYEELVCPETNALIEQRFTQGEQPNFSYAMLVERLLYFERIGAPFYTS